jgi:hypothetical protein
MGGVPPSVPDHGNRPTDRWQDFSLSPVTSHESPVTPSVPLQPNAFGATIRKGARILHDPGKQLRSHWCLKIESGHREPFDNVPGRRPRFGRGCKSCLGPAFYSWTDQQGDPNSPSVKDGELHWVGKAGSVRLG